MNSQNRYRRSVHWVAIFATAFTLPLLYVGGSVTTYRVGLGRAGLADHLRREHVPLQLPGRPVRGANRARSSAVWRRGRARHDCPDGMLAGVRGQAMAEGSGRARFGRGHPPGRARRIPGETSRHVPGGGPRLHGTGVLRPDGCALRLDGARLERRPAAIGRSRSPTAAIVGRPRPGLHSDRARGLDTPLRDLGRPCGRTGSSRRPSGRRRFFSRTGSNANEERSLRWSSPGGSWA